MLVDMMRECEGFGDSGGKEGYESLLVIISYDSFLFFPFDCNSILFFFFEIMRSWLVGWLFGWNWRN